MKEEKKCEDCTLKACPEDCFNSHPGSIIALEKLCNSLGIKAEIIYPTSEVI